MEADLAFQGIDLRDLYRPGSSMTLRRLRVLVDALPADALLRLRVAHAQKAADDAAKLARLRQRQSHYAPKGDRHG